MSRQKSPIYFCTVFITALLLTTAIMSGCSDSFSPESAAESVTAMCKDEYNLDIKAKVYGKTLWVYLPLQGLVDSKGQIFEKAGENIQNAVLCTQRVVMSMNNPLDFFVLVASDIRDMGAEFTLICNTFDIKRVRLMDISRGEYQKRILRDLKLNPSAIGDTEGSHVRLSDLDMGKFLAEQLNRRIKRKFESSPELSEKFSYNSGKWYFKDGAFIFNLDISKKNKPETETDAAEKLQLRSSENTEKEAIEIALNEIAFVIHRYGFKEYEKVRITNFSENDTRILTPAEMESAYQKMK